MNTVTQKMMFRQSLIQFAEKKGVTKAAIKYNVSRQYVYRWKNRYDGTLQSLADKSHRPHSHPNQHNEDELQLIRDMRRRNPHAGLVVFWVKLRQRGYKRSITGLYRVLRRLGEPRKTLPNPKYIPKPYEKMYYPGQRVQIDVKFVPTACIVGDAKAKGEKYYQYTAIDEYSRFRYIEAFQEHNSYSSTVFLEHMLGAFPFNVECGGRLTAGRALPKRLGYTTRKRVRLPSAADARCSSAFTWRASFILRDGRTLKMRQWNNGWFT